MPSSVIPAVLGGALLGLVLIDLVKTTLTLRGGGPITAPVAAGIWWALMGISRRLSSRRLLSHGGPAIAVSTVIGWILLEWIAWTLIFLAGAPGVIESQSGQAADIWGRIYYAGYSLFTLGLGDYRPLGPLWQILTDLAAANGFLTISLSAAYLIPVVSAAVKKRQIAIHVQALGRSPQDILISGWNGTDFSRLSQHLTPLAPTVIQVGQQHLAYPVLHYFSADDKGASLPIAMATLDEALGILEFGVRADYRPPAPTSSMLTDGIRSFLESLSRTHIRATQEVPPPPSLEPLRRAGIPVVDEAEFHRSLEQRAHRRRLSLSLVRDANWHWDDTQAKPFAAKGP